MCSLLFPVTDTDFDVEAYYPVTLFIEAEVLSSQEGPDAEELYKTMRGANYTEFITAYVWYAPSPLFHETQRVYFSSSLDAGLIPGSPTPPGTEEPQSEVTSVPTMAMTASQSEEVDPGIPDETTGAILPTSPPELTVTDAPKVEMTDLPEETEPSLETGTDIPATATSIPSNAEAEITGSTGAPMSDSPVEVPDIATSGPDTAAPSTTDEETGELTVTDAPAAPEETGVPEVEVTSGPEMSATDSPEAEISTSVPSTASTSGEAESNPVVLSANMEFGFFPDVEVSEPTPEQVGDLVSQINRFYDDVLSPEYENFQTFETNGESLETSFTIIHPLFIS
jgi:hypothetical protein